MLIVFTANTLETTAVRTTTLTKLNLNIKFVLASFGEGDVTACRSTQLKSKTNLFILSWNIDAVLKWVKTNHDEVCFWQQTLKKHYFQVLMVPRIFARTL